MAGAFSTATEEMQRAAQRVGQVNEQVQAQLSALRGQLAPLAGAWRGEASTAFQGLMARWDTDARNLNQALQGIGVALKGSHDSYLATEQQQMQSMTSITSALG